VASERQLTIHDIAPIRRNQAPLQESVLRQLLERPSTIDELTDAAYGFATDGGLPEAAVRKAIYLLRKRLLPGWHIDTETRYVLRRR
jgi:hypothetical protein